MIARRRRLLLELLEGRDAPAVFTVSTTADAGAGSLRQAILDADAHPGLDSIQFAISTGPQTIAPATALPDITDPVVVDGASQPGYSGTPLIVLSGSAAPVGTSGLVLANHTGSTVRGLEIINFSKDFTGTFVDAAGINIRNGGGHTIQGDYIGTDGTTADPNGYAGVLVNNSANNLIGGTTAAARNVISGNGGVGVFVANPLSTGNSIQGNYIGTDATGAHAIPNGAANFSIGGIVIAGFGANGSVPVGKNNVGGTAAGAGNLIAFERFAVQVVGSSGNPILGNSMHDNGVGILLDSTFHPNHPPTDNVTGGNDHQNQPLITGVAAAGATLSGLQITGMLTSTPNTQFRIEMFRSTKSGADGWGNGQGEALLGTATVTTDASGNASFSVQTATVPAGQYVVATATNVATGDTSPFSKPMAIPGSIGGGTTSGTGFAIAAASGEPRVWLYNADGTLRRTFLAFAPGFTGGVHVATADLNGDGVLDVIAAAAAGGGPQVKVFDGATGSLLANFFAYAPTFTGGVSVAVGDVNGDGKLDIITGAGPGGGPHVKVVSGADGSVLASYFAYSPNFHAGINVAAGDVDGDGKADIVTAPMAGGGPHLRVWHDGTGQLMGETFAYNGTFIGGLSVAVGDFDGDGKADIAVGPQTGGPARIRVLSGNLTDIKDIEVYQDSYRAGTSVAMRDIDGNGEAEVLVTINANGKPKVFEIKSNGDTTEVLTPDAAAPGSVFIG
ncbi:MAG TPA: FG-GAP-like repeat-containing protein [Gemmataceae bacterium]|nr:FG-GAP-like repeat-containing protein [Gemmataceae bacterium]